MTTLTNSFEGGTSGGTISTANSGGASGNAFNVVTIGALSSLTFSNTRAAHGSLSAQVSTGNPSANAIMGWTTSLTAGTLSQVWVRAYCYITGFPPANLRAIRVNNSGTLCGAIGFNSSGKVVLLDGGGTTRGTSTTTLPLNQWCRIEGYVIASASAGQVQAQIFLGKDSAIPTETVTTAANLNTTGPLNRVDFGNPASAVSFTYWVDDVGASTAGYIGPFGAGSRRGTSIVPSLIAAGAI